MLENYTLRSFEPVLRELARLARVVARRRWPFAAAAAVPVLATAIYVVRAPDRYEATARVIIGEDEGALELGPAFTPRSNELENQLEMIKSHEVLANAAVEGRRLYAQAPPSYDEIEAALKVKALQDTDIVEITTEAESSGRAAAWANLVADAYIEAHLRDRRKSASQAKAFIEAQLALYEQRLKESEEDLENYKCAAGVASLPAEMLELIKMEAGLGGDLEQTRVDLAVAEGKCAYFEDKLRETEERLMAEAAEVSSPVAQQLQEKLIRLEYRYANLILKGYSPSHTELVALAGEISLAKQKLVESAAELAGGEYNINLFDKTEEIARELDGDRAEVSALRTRERELAGAVAAAGVALASQPEKEKTLARLTREKGANENMYMLLLEKREEARITEASEVGTARVFSRAMPPAEPFAPRRKQSLLLGIFSGLLLGAAAVALVEYFDRTVKSVATAQHVAGANVLAVIPYFGRRSGGRKYAGATPKNGGRDALNPARVVVEAPKSPAADAFRQLYAQLSHLFANNGAGKDIVLGITSSRAQEGKSTVASNLTLSFAQLGTPTLLVDADLERGTVGRTSGVHGRPGLADFLRGDASWEEILNRSDVEGLALIGAGTKSLAQPALLASPRFETLLENARRDFTLTVFDVPPVFPIADVALVAGAIREFLFVVRAGVIGYQELERAVHTLKQVGGEVVGVTLNCAAPAETYGYGYGNYHYRYYYRGEEADRRS